MLARRVLADLTRESVPFVLIGGVALTAHGSPRVSLDTDIAIKAIDTDRVVELAYRAGLVLVIGVDREEHPRTASTAAEAEVWLRGSRMGFMKYLAPEMELDFVTSIPVPFMRLYTMATVVELDGLEVRIASLTHLKIMKEHSIRTRDDPDKVRADKLDLEFILGKMDRGGRETEP